MTTDPSAALDMIKSEPYVLVLSDIKMPGLSGIELMKKVKKIDPDIEFIMVTAVNDTNIAIKAIKMGACDFIIKPFDVGEIVESVNDVIRSREEKETGPAIQTIASANNTDSKSEEEREIESAMQVFASADNAPVGSEGITKCLAQDLVQTFQIAAEFFGTDGKVYSEMVIKHSERVESLVINVAKRIKLPPILRAQIADAALLHDIGKIGMVVPATNYDNCLGKQDKQIYKMHPVRGEALVEPIRFLRTASLFIRHHHEQYGGGGYPNGFKGDKIPIGSRIIAVADAYDRCKYLPQQDDEDSEKKARAYIRKCSGELFDPKIVKRFLTYLNELD